MRRKVSRSSSSRYSSSATRLTGPIASSLSVELARPLRARARGRGPASWRGQQRRRARRRSVRHASCASSSRRTRPSVAFSSSSWMRADEAGSAAAAAARSSVSIAWRSSSWRLVLLARCARLVLEPVALDRHVAGGGVGALALRRPEPRAPLGELRLALPPCSMLEAEVRFQPQRCARSRGPAPPPARPPRPASTRQAVSSPASAVSSRLRRSRWRRAARSVPRSCRPPPRRAATMCCSSRAEQAAVSSRLARDLAALRRRASRGGACTRSCSRTDCSRSFSPDTRSACRACNPTARGRSSARPQGGDLARERRRAAPPRSATSRSRPRDLVARARGCCRLRAEQRVIVRAARSSRCPPRSRPLGDEHLAGAA